MQFCIRVVLTIGATKKLISTDSEARKLLYQNILNSLNDIQQIFVTWPPLRLQSTGSHNNFAVMHTWQKLQ